MTRRNARRAAALLPVIGLLVAACGGGDEAGTGGTGGTGGDAVAAGGESCYEGETATFTVPYSPGGGYDTIARGLAPFLKDELGADAVVVENRPGAGGLVAAKELYTAEPDGLSFQLLNTQGILGAFLAEAEGVNFDPREFTYVARLAQDARVLLTGANSGLGSIDDVLNAEGELQYATAGVGAADHIDANVVPVILGIEDKVSIVSGFDGSSETELAVTAGQVDVGSGTLGTRLGGIESGDQVALLLMGRERAEQLPDVPALLELDLANPDLAEAYIDLQESGRSVFAPPGVPDNCLQELQAAFETVLDDPEFQEKIGGSVDVPFEYTGGEELRETAENVLDAPEELVTLLKQAYNE